MAYNPIPPVGQDDMAGSLPVVIASDQSAVTVDLGVNNDVTVTGSVTANAGTNLNTSALALESGGNLATIAGDTTAIQTAVELLDDTVYTDGAGTPSKGILALGTDGTNPQAIKTDAAGELQVDVLSMPSTTVTATDLDIRNLVNTDVVTAELSATDNAVLDAIAASVAAIDVDTTTLIGHVDGLETSNSAIQTSVELIDDAIKADDAAFTPATTKVMMAGFEYDDTTPDSVDEGDAGAARMSARRELYTQIRDAAGNERGLNVTAAGTIGSENYQGGTAVGAANPLQVSLANTAANATAVKVNVASGGIASGAIASGAIASGAIASGAIAAGAIAAGNTSIATTEDTARAAGEHLVKVGLSRLDVPVANANVTTDGDYTNFIADNFGKLWTAGSVPEDTAHIDGEAITQNGARRIDTPATSAGTSGDWATVNQDAYGLLYTHAMPTAIDLATVATPHTRKYYTNAGAVTDGIIWSPAAGKRWFVTDLIINTSAAAVVTIEDDLTAGDAVVMKFELAANSGISHTFNTPIYSGEDAADLLVTTSAGNIYITAVGYEI